MSRGCFVKFNVIIAVRITILPWLTGGWVAGLQSDGEGRERAGVGREEALGVIQSTCTKLQWGEVVYPPLAQRERDTEMGLGA